LLVFAGIVSKRWRKSKWQTMQIVELPTPITGVPPRCREAIELLPPMLPMRGHVRARFVKVDMLVDMIDPRYRNEVMMLTVRRALFGQLDLVGAFEMVDLPDRFAVRRNDIHVLLDLRRIRHVRVSLGVPG
jgi:hypothetical protein